MRLHGIPKGDGFYMPAEYEKHAATVMVFPERPGSWPHEAKPAQRIFAGIIKEIARDEDVYVVVSEKTMEAAGALLKDVPQVHFWEIPTDDAWARDTAPTFVTDGQTIRGVDWQFNAWGGSFDGLYAHWERDNALAARICENLRVDFYDAQHFVLEGGSIHSNGAGTVLTTESCLLSSGRNPQMSKAEIENNLKAYLGAERVLWLPRGIYNDETNEHVDNVCAFIRRDEVVLAWTDQKEDPQYAMSAACLRVLEKAGLTVHKLPIPDVPVCVTKEDMEGYLFEEGEEVREEGERLAASYVNFYFTNGAVLLPQFGGENAESDARAVEIMQRLCPGRRIVPVPAREIITGGGNIHCITQQIPGV